MGRDRPVGPGLDRTLQIHRAEDRPHRIIRRRRHNCLQDIRLLRRDSDGVVQSPEMVLALVACRSMICAIRLSPRSIPGELGNDIVVCEAGAGDNEGLPLVYVRAQRRQPLAGARPRGLATPLDSRIPPL
jgi:hypothetical protein